VTHEEREDARWIGRTIDRRYRILGRLGDGGMGSVFEAEHLSLGKRVAFKIILPELVRDEEVRARFEREARATAAIEHPHVAAAMDFGRLPDGGAYLVVQRVQGKSIRQRIEEGPVPWREACAIGAQIADALSAIHSRGFVHRDLTTENVLLTTKEDGSPFVHVLDLGVAGLWRPIDGESRLTVEGHVVGTPGYMPPEQALGKATDPRADLYALGVLLWEMCAGRSLWGSRELTQVVAAQLTDEPPAIPELGPSAPAELAKLIERLLAREPADRPGDAVEVRDALRACLGAPSVVSPSPRRSMPRVRPAWIAAGLGALLVLGGVVTAVALLASDDQEEPAPAPVPVAAAPEPTPAAVEPPTAAPSALSPVIEQLLTARMRTERREAAEQLLAVPSTPEWARAAADLELAHTCGAREDALERLEQAGDPAALPAIARVRAAPRTGCGRGRRSDCYACVRELADRAWRACGGGEGPSVVVPGDEAPEPE
jgi:serine/threonine-protein kinase